MKFPYTALTVVFVLASVPLAWSFLHRRSAGGAIAVVRVGTFNVAMNRDRQGALLAELESGDSRQAKQIAEIVQRNALDVVLLCEVDRDEAGRAAELFATQYLGKSQNGQPAIDFTYRFCGPVNTGEPSGLDLDRDGKTDGPGDAFGFGRFPGQYGMVVLSRHPILTPRIRTFQKLPWSAMPGAARPEGYWDDATWGALRLSSKSHWDVPIGVGPVQGGRVVHLLCSHPTPPAFDGPEDRNGCRNHDEIRFWVDYLTPGKDEWIVDDAGTRGGLPAGESFVVLGDLNCDPVDGDARRDALQALLAHPRVQDPLPRSEGGASEAVRQWGANSGQHGDAALDTADFADKPASATDKGGPGNLRVDYVLPSRDLVVHACKVFWPPNVDVLAALAAASDHRLVWADLQMR
ncbi:MAG: endonuclease/exonuclease/phosphatase family protein [Planctomycetota bacterium]